jgi:hypothetical protein
VVDGGVAAHGGEHAERHRHHEREDKGGAREEQRGGQALEHEAEGRAPVAQRLAEVPAHGAAHEARVLDGEGIVEAQALPEFVGVLGLDVHRHEEEHGIAAEAHHAEDRGERQEDHERRLHETGEEVAPHGATVVSRAPGATGSSCGT